MTNIHITEADVGRKFRLRNGDIIEVTEFNPEYFLSVKGSHKLNTRSWSPTGMYVIDDVDAFDIVERLPDESHKVTMDSLLKSAKPFGSANPKSKAPTMTASDGKQYPVQYWTTQQRFDEVTPPIGANIKIYENGYLLSGEYSFDDKKNVFHKCMFWFRGERFEGTNSTWTIAPTPAVEKVEPHKRPHTEWLNFKGDFLLTAGNGDCVLLSEAWIKSQAETFVALSERIKFVLSQHKGES